MSKWDRRKDVDDGLIIGYEPKFTFNKDNHVIKDQDLRENLEILANQSDVTKTLKDFRDITPAKTIESLLLTNKYLKDVMDDLSEAFSEGSWNKYTKISTLLQAIENNDEEYINSFVSYHSDSITGSDIPELLWDLHHEKQRVDTFINTTYRIFFGDDFFTDGETKELNENSYKTLLSFENNYPERVNYMAIRFDSQYCKALDMYSYHIRKKALEELEIINDSEYNITSNASKESLNTMFNDVLKKEKWRFSQYSTQHTKENIKKAIYGFYNNRKSLKDYYNLKEEIPNNAYQIFQMISDKRDETRNSIKNIVKIMLADTYYMGKMQEIRKEKRLLRKIYAIINNN